MKASRRQIPVYVPPRTVWAVGAQVVLLVMVGTALRHLGPVLTVLSLALLLALAMDPLVRLLSRWGVRRGPGVALVALLLLALTGLLVFTLVPMLVNQLQNLVRALPSFVAELSRIEWIHRLDERYGVLTRPQEAFDVAPGELAKPLVDVLSSTLALVGAGITMLALAVFGLLFGEDLYATMLGWVRPRRRVQVRRVVGRMREAVGNYLAGTLLVSTFGGTMTALVSLVLGVPYFLPLGLMTAVLGVIPYIGSVISAILVSLTTLATVGLRRAFIALALFMLYQQLESHLLGPLVQRRAVKMNPLLISVVVLVGAGMAGLLGAVIAVPVAAATQVVLQEVHRARRRKWKQEWRRVHPRALPLTRGAVDEGLLFAGPMSSPRGGQRKSSRPSPEGEGTSPH
ncbi:AI-2E family transporter [Myxococcaceae bacterium JPH2]|nr:AI-2E family transporter [Myxococcaceae bacterium JPH2]